MKRMTFVAAPLLVAGLMVSTVGVAAADPIGDIAGGIGTGMQVGGSIGGLLDMGIGSAGGDLEIFEGIAGVFGKLLGGSIGLGAVVLPTLVP